MTSDTPWLDRREMRAWVRLATVLELLPGVLDAQLRQDAGVTHFEYFVLGRLSEAPDRTLRLTDLARRTSATLPRLSNVLNRLEERRYVERFACPEDRRATNARLTDLGWAKVQEAAPGHVATVRHHVIDGLKPRELDQLADITAVMLSKLGPMGEMAVTATTEQESEVT